MTDLEVGDRLPGLLDEVLDVVVLVLLEEAEEHLHHLLLVVAQLLALRLHLGLRKESVNCTRHNDYILGRCFVSLLLELATRSSLPAKLPTAKAEALYPLVAPEPRVGARAE